MQIIIHDQTHHWIFKDHIDNKSELSLTLKNNHQQDHYVIDRVCIDDQGQYWIIDFKLSEPAPDETLDVFLSQQLHHYQSQLNCYHRLFSKVLKKQTIKLALYFPLLGVMKELRSLTTE